MKENKDKMIVMKNQGITYAEIGKCFDISRQRVHQIISSYKSPFTLNLKIESGLRGEERKRRIAEELEKRIIILAERKLDFGLELTDDQQEKIDWCKRNLFGREYKREMIRIYFNHTCQNKNCNKVWQEGERRFDVHHFSCNPEDTRKYDTGKLKDIIHSVTVLCHKCHLNLPEHRQKMIDTENRKNKIAKQIREENQKI